MKNAFDDIYGGKYLSAAGVTDTRTLKISEVTTETFEKPGEPTRRKALLWFDAEDRALVLNKTNASAMAYAFGKDFSDWVGREIEVRNEPTNFAGKMVPSLRVYPKRTQAAVAASRRAELNDEVPF